ncbi:phosphatase PAP2 family protein [Streptomyces flavidovirens]|uniref:phosphatase PAP2 family protein n=1 Tax=Streptomyces flavidovirens TaxID=67298 RepID=UPI00041A0A1C|nr:phosphatase PAP2 family protein [Streptomyces flavidovirens]
MLLISVLAMGLGTLGEGRAVFQGLDDQWMNLMSESSSDAGTGLARALDRLGGPLGMIVPLILAGCLTVYGRWRSSVFVLAACVMGNIVVVLPLKWLVDRPRPPQPWVLVNDGSFPSGQVFTVTTLVLTAGVVLLPTVARRCWWALAVALVIAMMWSRTWLHAQWLSDTVAGAAAGVGVVLLLWSAFARLLREEAVRAASGRLLD